MDIGNAWHKTNSVFILGAITSYPPPLDSHTSQLTLVYPHTPKVGGGRHLFGFQSANKDKEEEEYTTLLCVTIPKSNNTIIPL